MNYPVIYAFLFDFQVDGKSLTATIFYSLFFQSPTNFLYLRPYLHRIKWLSTDFFYQYMFCFWPIKLYLIIRGRELHFHLLVNFIWPHKLHISYNNCSCLRYISIFSKLRVVSLPSAESPNMKQGITEFKQILISEPENLSCY